MRLLLIIIASLALVLPCGAAHSHGISYDNGLFKYEMSFMGDRIRVLSWKEAGADVEKLASSQKVPYFEFMTDKGLMTSEMPVWKHMTTTKQTLSNGSVMYTSEFKGKGNASGISMCLDLQFFPDAVMVRERLRVRQGSGRKVRFACQEGSNVVRYPFYSFSGNCDDVMEVRMATFNHDDAIYAGRTFDNRSPNNLGLCHMFHVDSVMHTISQGEDLLCKGPFTIVSSGQDKIVAMYEHASQDVAIHRFDKCGAGIDREPVDDDYWFIATKVGCNDGVISVGSEVLKGGYLDGELLPESGWYETVWSVTGIVHEGQDPAEFVRDYLTNKITASKSARRVDFYYNTWGLQRDAAYEGEELRKIFNEQRILKEIDYAAQLGVDLFVFDDGWQKSMGVWEPDSLKLPSGLTPLVERIREHGMIAGAWISLAGVDSLSRRCMEHPEWIIKDASGKPIKAQYKHPALDLVSSCIDELKKDHIKLIDAGIRFFKWDAVNTFHSYQPGLGHGGEEYSRQERIDRYNYLLPFYVTRLMRELKEYEPEVDIEIDLTEPERALIGLMPLQYGKFFWMNNGASGYGDYSTYRGKSMRRIVSTNFRWLPYEIITYASYPHNQQPYFAQRYNVNTSLIAGRGFWGNLSRMTEEQRLYVGNMVRKSKKVVGRLKGLPMNISGKIGASPEIYWQLDKESSFGQLFAFSGSEISHSLSLEVNPDNFLGVLDHSYSMDKDGNITFDLEFAMPDDSREAFILGNMGSGVSVTYATGWLEDIEVSGNSLKVLAGASGVMQVTVPDGVEPEVSGAVSFTKEGNSFIINYLQGETVILKW